jgi:hypothetical protein
MNKNLKLFFKSLSFSNILFKIFILFLVGLLSRFLIHNLFDFTFLIELFSLFSIPLCINLFSFDDSVDPKFFNDNITSFKRPRDRVINDDYEFKSKFRRKCHWVFGQQFSSDFVDFKDFKDRWTPDKKFNNILKDKYYDKKYKVVLFKKTLMWFINVRNR